MALRRSPNRRRSWSGPAAIFDMVAGPFFGHDEIEFERFHSSLIPLQLAGARHDADAGVGDLAARLVNAARRAGALRRGGDEPGRCKI
jgi:hypothetical protein